MTREELIQDGCLTPFSGRKVSRSQGEARQLLLDFGKKASVAVEEGASATMVLIGDRPGVGSIAISVGKGASVVLSQMVLASVLQDIRIVVAEDAELRMDSQLFSASSTSISVELAGNGSRFIYNGMFLASGSDRIDLSLGIRHMACHTLSRSVVKGVSSGHSVGQFSGLVYVASGAQQTDASQTSRNLEIGGGRIVTSPQLEIYADDVSCSHGATVGKLDEEAVYYMRQRGISLEVAQQLQTDGFLRDITSRSGVECISSWAGELLDEKLKRL